MYKACNLLANRAKLNASDLWSLWEITWSQPSTQTFSSRLLNSLNVIWCHHDVLCQAEWAGGECLGTRLTWSNLTYFASAFFEFLSLGEGGGLQISRSINALVMKLGTYLVVVISLTDWYYDVSWRHNGVTNPPFWIWGRNLGSQTRSHTVDNDDIEKYMNLF